MERPLYHVADEPPQPNFDPVARIYRFAEYLALGPLLQRTRNHFLPQLPPRRHALLLGDGDGRFTARLLAFQPNLHATAVDTSAAMLSLLRRHCQPHASRLQTLQASALGLFESSGKMRDSRCERPDPVPSSLAPSSHLASPISHLPFAPDLIVTHFFLDCLAQPQLITLTQNLAAHTAPGTLWLLSDFAIPQRPILSSLATLYVRLLYLAFRILTGLRVTHLPNPQTALASAGFRRLARHELVCGLLYAEIWQLQ